MRHALAAITLTAGLAVLTSSASAQEVQITGPLANAPACRNCRVYRRTRLQVQPFVGFTLQDEYTRTMVFGAQVNFHFVEWLGIGVWGGFGGVHLDTGLTDEVTSIGQSTERNRLSLPSREGFPDQIGIITWMAAGQVTFIPLRGKLSLFQKLFVDADFYVVGGVAAVGIEERADVDDSGAFGPRVCDGPTVSATCLDSQIARASRVAIAPTFGVGLTLMFNNFMGLTFEWRAIPFAWNTSGTDEGNPDDQFPDGVIDANDRVFHFNHMFSLGLAFYLPPDAAVSE